MKTTFIIVALLFHGLECFCQKTNSQQTLTQEDYLKKSKRQKTTAWILLGGGVATSIIGLSQINLAGSDNGEVNNTPGTILFFTGLAATITSIHFFSASKKNRKKAASVSSNIELKPSNLGIGQTLFKRVYPSLTVKVSF